MTARVAIIGAGIGAEHLAAYAKLPDLFDVRILCDLDVDRAQKAVVGYGDIQVMADFDAVLKDAAIDLVDICLPPHLHVMACLKALEAGKAVICEKPLAPSLAEVDQIAAKLTQTNGFLSPVFQYRFGQGAAQLTALIAAGLTGQAQVATLETHWNRDAVYYKAPWRGTWAGENGGALLGHAIHIHDLIRHFMGPVASIYARTATRVNDIEVEDCAALSLEMDNGALVTSSVTLGAAQDASRLKLVFENVTVESDQSPYAPAAKPWRFTARAPMGQARIDDVVSDVAPAPVGFEGYLRSVAKALQGDRSQMVTLADARASIEFVTTCYASARRGEVIALPYPKTGSLYAGWTPS